jgi:hypothetical protein
LREENMTDEDSNYAVGKNYEDFVETVYKALLEAEKRNGQIGHIAVERRKKIISKSGTPAEIDIYWVYELAGIKNSVAIECRNYNKKVDIPGVRDFARKISNISGLKGLMVSTKGFSENAILEAKSDNIDLLIIREHGGGDFDGRITKVNITIHVMPVSRITRLNVSMTEEMAVKNKASQGDQFFTRNDQTIVEDRATGFKHSFLELEQSAFFENKGPGKHTWKKDFQDGWIHFEGKSFQIQALQVEYITPPPMQQEIAIDFEQYVLAIMEYVSGGQGKFVVLKSGEKKSL